MSINYFAPLMNGEEMMATAKILQQGNSIVTAEGLVNDSKGSVVAKSIGTFKIMQMNR
jgi:acyl-CoA thioesterase